LYKRKGEALHKNHGKGYMAQKILVRKKNGKTNYIFIEDITGKSKTINPLKKFLSLKKAKRL
jgi:hypothetical protein